MLLAFLDALQWIFVDQGGADDLGPLRVFRYITVRAAGALAFAFIVTLAIGPWMIGRLAAHGAGQVVRRATKKGAISLHDMHGEKEGTPTMGGLLIMASVFASVMIFAQLTNELVLLLVAVSMAYAALGFWDDYAKIIHRNHLGLSAKGKILGQLVFGLALGMTLTVGDWSVFYEQTGDVGYPYLLLPLFKGAYPFLGLGFLVLTALVMVGASNAVNLTDGLDGLAIGVTITSAAAFTVMAYLASRTDYSSYLSIPYVPGSGEVVVFGSALVGGGLGFLWFNSHPAQVFMGDTGSMMLGGALGTMAILIKQELLLVVVGGVFVAEAVSVILQVGSFKMTGKRIFRMAPLHHHYEKHGIHENKIIIRFWIAGLLLALLGIASLKLR